METYRKPSYRSCLVGIILGGIVYLAFWSLAFAFPLATTALDKLFLFFPDKLGLVEKPTLDDRIVVTYPQDKELKLPKSGRYWIYSTNLLPAEDRVVLKSKATGEQIPVPYILDGVNEYGEITLEQPVFWFEVDQAGEYEFDLQRLPRNTADEYWLLIIRDFTGKNRTILMISVMLHLGVVGVVARKLYYWKNKDRIAQEREKQDAKRARFEEWMEKQKSN